MMWLIDVNVHLYLKRREWNDVGINLFQMINNDGYTYVEIKSQGKNCQGLDIFVSKSKWKKQSDEKATNLPPNFF